MTKDHVDKGGFTMQKMFTTQLTGLFNRILSSMEFEMEDGARLIAQALVGDGKVFIKGFHEMNGVVFEALEGEEPLERAHLFEEVEKLTPADRMVIFTRYSDDEKAISLANQLIEKNIPFVAVAGLKKEVETGLHQLADIFINTNIIKPLLPGEDGERVGFPSLMASLYIYHCLKFTIDEMLAEYE